MILYCRVYMFPMVVLCGSMGTLYISMGAFFLNALCGNKPEILLDRFYIHKIRWHRRWGNILFRSFSSQLLSSTILFVASLDLYFLRFLLNSSRFYRRALYSVQISLLDACRGWVVFLDIYPSELFHS